tara:strand:+ start:24 stop:593 length:570 start_codon:yes stop_codon:yes gene_type:complete
MLVGDKNALIVAARCTGYGHGYGTTLTCPSCAANSKLDIDLEEAAQKYAGYVAEEADEPLEGVEGPDTSGNYYITLPVSQARFEVKLMTGRDEKAFAKRLETRRKKRQAEAMLTDQFKTFTLSVNGVGDLRQMYRFIDNLPVRDSRFLRTQYQKLSPALNLKHDFVCQDCGYEQEVEVPITAQFFWPDA